MSTIRRILADVPLEYSEASLQATLDGAASVAELFYIQNVGFCGNCIKFWCVDGHGYTMDLNDAWKVTREEADRICRSRPKEDIPLSAMLLDSLAERHINIEALREHQRKEAQR